MNPRDKQTLTRVPDCLGPPPETLDLAKRSPKPFWSLAVAATTSHPAKRPLLRTRGYCSVSCN